MIFIVLNLQGERVRNLTGKASHHFVAGGIDALTVKTQDDHIQKGFRLLYRDGMMKKWYEFIVVSPDDIHTVEGITREIYAENSITDLRGHFIEDRRGVQDTGASAIAKLTEGTHWDGYSDDVGRANYNFYRETGFDALSKTIEAFSCEMETEIQVGPGYAITRKVRLKRRVGTDTGKRFSYRKDMRGIIKTVTEDDIITRLYPFGKGEETENGYGRRITIKPVNGGKMYIENVEAQARYGYKGEPFSAPMIYEDVEDPGELLALAKKDLEVLSAPTVSYQASVIDLASYGFDFEGVGIGDTVAIRDRELDLALKGRVSELVKDLDGEEETQITLGYIRPALGRELSEVAKTLDRITAKEGLLDKLGDKESFIDMVIKGLNAGFENAKSFMRFSEDDGLTFTDHPDPARASWAINIGSRGFRIASGKLANGEWNWRTFGTGEGFTADLIRTGKIKGELITLDGKTTVTSDFSVAGGNVTLSGDTTVLGTFKVPTSAVIGTLSADRIDGGTINASRIKVTNLDADYITDGTLRRGVDNGSCTLPEYGSAYLSGSGTNLNTGSSKFRFIYEGSYENTFLVDGRITAKPGGGQHMAFQVGGLYVGANGGYFQVSPGSSGVNIQTSGPCWVNDRLSCTGLTIGSATLTESDINKLKRL